MITNLMRRAALRGGGVHQSQTVALNESRSDRVDGVIACPARQTPWIEGSLLRLAGTPGGRANGFVILSDRTYTTFGRPKFSVVLRNVDNAPYDRVWWQLLGLQFSLWSDSLSKRHARAEVPGRLTRGSTGDPLAAHGTLGGRSTQRMAGSGPAMTAGGRHVASKDEKRCPDVAPRHGPPYAPHPCSNP